MNTRARHAAAMPRAQRGFVLILSLLMLLVLTILGVSLISGVTLQQKMSANTREKARAFEAAQAALRSAESWLISQTSIPVGVGCSAGSSSTPEVCNAPLATPQQPSTWPAYVTFTPSGFTTSQSGGKDTYFQPPRYYIYDLGASSGGAHAYRITAAAWGGNANAVAVVQAVFELNGAKGGNTPAASLGGA